MISGWLNFEIGINRILTLIQTNENEFTKHYEREKIKMKKHQKKLIFIEQ